MKKYGKIIIILSLLLIFSIIAINVFNDKSMVIDEMVQDLASNLVRDNLTPIVKVITWCGDSLCMIITTILVLIFVKKKKIGLSVLINLLVIAILNFVLKLIWMRPRPELDMLIYEDGFSFPSGHSMVSMAFYGYLIYLIYTYVDNRKVKWPLLIFLMLIILLIGFSRIYLGVHYASDVIGGFCFSIVYLFIYIKIAKKYI